MADNPNKKKADGKRVSKQTHEEAYHAKNRRSSGSSGNNKRSGSSKKS